MWRHSRETNEWEGGEEQRGKHRWGGRGGGERKRRKKTKNKGLWTSDPDALDSKMFSMASAVTKIESDEMKYVPATVRQSSVMLLGKEEETNVIKRTLL